MPENIHSSWGVMSMLSFGKDMGLSIILNDSAISKLWSEQFGYLNMLIECLKAEAY